MTEMAKAGGELKGKGEDYQGGKMGEKWERQPEKCTRKEEEDMDAPRHFTHIHAYTYFVCEMNATDMYCHYHFLYLL